MLAPLTLFVAHRHRRRDDRRRLRARVPARPGDRVRQPGAPGVRLARSSAPTASSTPSASTASSSTARASPAPRRRAAIIASPGVGPCFVLNAAVLRGHVRRAARRWTRGALATRRARAGAPAGRSARRRGSCGDGPRLRTPLAMMVLVGTLSFNFQVLLPLLAHTTWHGTAATYALLTSAMGVGSVAGALLAGARGRVSLAPARRRRHRCSAPPSWPPPPRRRWRLQVAALVPLGAASVTFAAGVNSSLQLAAPPDLRGRVMALYSVVFIGSTPIGAPIAGWLAETHGPRAGLVLGGVAALPPALLAQLSHRRALGKARSMQARTLTERWASGPIRSSATEPATSGCTPPRGRRSPRPRRPRPSRRKRRWRVLLAGAGLAGVLAALIVIATVALTRDDDSAQNERAVVAAGRLDEQDGRDAHQPDLRPRQRQRRLHPGQDRRRAAARAAASSSPATARSSPTTTSWRTPTRSRSASTTTASPSTARVLGTDPSSDLAVLRGRPGQDAGQGQAADARGLLQRQGRRQRDRHRLPARARPDGDRRASSPASSRTIQAPEQLHDRQRPADGRADQPRQLRRAAVRRPRARDRRQRPDRHGGQQRQRRHRLRRSRRTPSARSSRACRRARPSSAPTSACRRARPATGRPARSSATSPPAGRRTGPGLRAADSLTGDGRGHHRRHQRQDRGRPGRPLLDHRRPRRRATRRRSPTCATASSRRRR